MLYVLLGFSVIVSLFGMVNTMVLSVFERTREIGMLRTIGMTRRQARRMIRHESIITALIGAALGIGLGLFLSALVTPGGRMREPPFSIPVQRWPPSRWSRSSPASGRRSSRPGAPRGSTCWTPCSTSRSKPITPMSITRACLLTVLVALAAAAPSGAVVGGEPVAPESVPWLAEVNGCGGMLVAPDRVLTAGHCVAHVPLSNFAGVMVGAEVRRGTRYAMHPGWRHANGPHNVLDDVALVQLDGPVTTVAPVALGGGAPSGESWILGRGRQFAPGNGAQREGDPHRDRPAPGGPAFDDRQGSARRCGSTAGATAASASTPLGCSAPSTSMGRSR